MQIVENINSKNKPGTNIAGIKTPNQASSQPPQIHEPETINNNSNQQPKINTIKCNQPNTKQSNQFPQMSAAPKHKPQTNKAQIKTQSKQKTKVNQSKYTITSKRSTPHISSTKTTVKPKYQNQVPTYLKYREQATTLTNTNTKPSTSKAHIKPNSNHKSQLVQTKLNQNKLN